MSSWVDSANAANERTKGQIVFCIGTLLLIVYYYGWTVALIALLWAFISPPLCTRLVRLTRRFAAECTPHDPATTATMHRMLADSAPL